MSVNLFRLSYVTSDAPVPVSAVSEVLARLQSGAVWDVASIAPANKQFPLMHIEWHEDQGFVIQCYEDERAWSDFLLSGSPCGPPSVEINLGGQALERWPAELFVSEELAGQALDVFLKTGKQDPGLNWVRIDSFPRETIWEAGTAQEA